MVGMDDARVEETTTTKATIWFELSLVVHGNKT